MDDASDRGRSLSPSPSSFVGGAAGGAFGTVLMTLLRTPITRELPPTADFWAQYVGDGRPEDYPLIALALHLAYGMGAGVAFGAFAGDADQTRSLRLAEAYAVPLALFGDYAVLRGLLGMDPDRDEASFFRASHLVYAVGLGAVVGAVGGSDSEASTTPQGAGDTGHGDD